MYSFCKERRKNTFEIVLYFCEGKSSVSSNYLVRVHHVEQLDDGGVLQLLQQGDLADGSARDALRLAEK